MAPSSTSTAASLALRNERNGLKKEDQLEMVVLTGEDEPTMDSWTEANVVSSLSIVDQISVIKVYSKF